MTSDELEDLQKRADKALRDAQEAQRTAETLLATLPLSSIDPPVRERRDSVQDCVRVEDDLRRDVR